MTNRSKTCHKEGKVEDYQKWRSCRQKEELESNDENNDQACGSELNNGFKGSDWDLGVHF
jgi:hypothetical protein